MKIEGHITAAEDHGGELKVTMQGRETAKGEWAEWRSLTFIVDQRRGRAESLYVGRELTVTIKPRKARK